MWNAHTASASKNQSTATCTSQRVGYTFSLAQILANDAAQHTLVDSESSFGKLTTRVLLILPINSIIFTGLSLLLVLYGATATIVMPKPPFNILRIAFLAIVAAAHLFTISSAKITVLAKEVGRTIGVDEGVQIRAWEDKGFYLFTWLSTALIWVVMGLGIVVGFMFTRVQMWHEKNIA
ncbi:hypothetical protein OIDMADRAFT_51482 [Oidiodendron maius Zn]|uniref:Uncharacterized protein n=1 Tax=Oidiodendron maius (strain Zn) TaxID=913774 RepID=A0A0C3H5Q3_OIDMZ|nr:hypothetical protein OIDMADRAFT_51482 [Oidiodendron maius Zn]